ncbi:MAG: serine/threonine-protein phosphatase [Actinomycetales bacterium]|nr:serine/threonine-protein phosphatase [Actinomycetales bacterium]
MTRVAAARRRAAARRLRLPDVARWRRLAARQPSATAVLVGLSVLSTLGMVWLPAWVPPTSALFVVLLGVFVLRVPGMAVLCAAVVGQAVAIQVADLARFDPGEGVVLGAGVLAAIVFVRTRDRLGLQGAASDLMLVDLRDRLEAHGRIPPLPPPWRVDSVVRSAYAEAFSGDFVVAARSRSGTQLEIVLVDVSGKGQDAGVRSLLLSGAFGGLLGTMPPEQFLPAANAYLLGQDWPEGFATAVHLTLRLDTGEFTVSTAGHPPAVHHHAGSGRVERLDTTGGPALGVVESPTFAVHKGVVEPGDTVMLYTDGLVESPGADVELGIDRLMGEVERFVATRSGGADAVVAGVRAGDTDDRALILVHRD